MEDVKLNEEEMQKIFELSGQVNTFIGALKQMSIGFSSQFNEALAKLVQDYKQRGMLIESQAKIIDGLKKQIADYEKTGAANC